MRKLLGLLLLLVTVNAVNAQHGGQHHIWNGLLQKHVNDKGEVNYAGFLADSESLDRYCYSLGANPPQIGWSANEQKAYWLNVYNAFTVKLILEYYPITSIKKITNPWDDNNVILGADTMSLNDVEHKMLLPKFNDPRIHVGINCASVSCPKLYNRAFTVSNVDQVLTQLMKEFLADKSKNELFKNEMRLSMIFNWFEGDFTKDGTLVDFMNAYSTMKVSKSAFISYMEYNWNLNE
ncbi:MAG: hypothetical protein ACJAUV_000976 [Flavobacteriales bacterium]|jgi:hypothetical protein